MKYNTFLNLLLKIASLKYMNLIPEIGLLKLCEHHLSPLY